MMTFKGDVKVKSTSDIPTKTGNAMIEVMLENSTKDGVKVHPAIAFGGVATALKKLVGKTIMVEGFVNSEEWKDRYYNKLSVSKLYLDLSDKVEQPATKPKEAPMAGFDLDSVAF